MTDISKYYRKLAKFAYELRVVDEADRYSTEFLNGNV